MNIIRFFIIASFATSTSKAQDAFLRDTCNCFCGQPSATGSPQLAGSIPIFGPAADTACSNTSCMSYFPVACNSKAKILAGCAHCVGGLNGNTVAAQPGPPLEADGSPSPQNAPGSQKGLSIPPGAGSFASNDVSTVTSMGLICVIFLLFFFLA
ncbi:hypothetical protein BDR26DRAFT_697572 [Obelidium mucronatum]|nr:hypothetical protein BDR26DRAFT_697572 [Obelidium mucronatum]